MKHPFVFPLEAPDDQPSDSLLILIGANLVPLLGVIFGGWDILILLLLFWLENGIIGIFNIFRMMLAQRTPNLSNWQNFVLIPFFVVHYASFMIGHGLILLAFFTLTNFKHGYDFEQAFPEVWIGVVGLIFSHGYSFVRNFLMRREYMNVTMLQQMGKPYSRVIVMQFTLIIGAFVVMKYHNQVYTMAALVLLKIGFDIKFHLRERRRYRENEVPVTAK